MTSVREVLEGIYKEHGSLTPALVLSLAREPDHPLHKRFEWDDSVAGERYRLGQARHLITTVKVRYVNPSDDTQTVRARAYHAMPTAQGTAFRSTDDIVVDEFARRLLQQQMRREFEALKARYERFDELWLMLQEAVDRHLEISA